ncbi:MAG: hypothetical protein AN484_28390, partial [Aphanizomenon flos-aquae WA102]
RAACDLRGRLSLRQDLTHLGPNGRQGAKSICTSSTRFNDDLRQTGRLAGSLWCFTHQRRLSTAALLTQQAKLYTGSPQDVSCQEASAEISAGEDDLVQTGRLGQVLDLAHQVEVPGGRYS